MFFFLISEHRTATAASDGATSGASYVTAAQSTSDFNGTAHHFYEQQSSSTQTLQRGWNSVPVNLGGDMEFAQ